MLRHLPKALDGNKMFKLPNRGYKMNQVHLSSVSKQQVTSGLRASIFGGNSNMGPILGYPLVSAGIPTTFVHRNPMDITCPVGMDTTYIKSNPYGTWNDFVIQYDIVNTVQ